MSSKMEGQLDTVSFLVTCPVDTHFKKLEMWLNKKGYSLGYFPQEGKNLTIRQILEKRISNKWERRYGATEDLCIAVCVETLFGEVQTRIVPGAATGPDFKKIWIGSKNRYGRIKEATFRLFTKPKKIKKVVLNCPSKKQPLFLKRLLGSGIQPASVERLGKTKFVIHLQGMRELVDLEEKTVRRLAT